MTADLDPVYTSAHPAGAAVLRCADHPDWEVDVDGTALPTVIREAMEHVRDAHGDEEGSDG